MVEPNRARVRAFFSLLRFIDVARRYLAVEFLRHKSNPMRMLVMNALYSYGGSMTPTELSKYVYRSKHSITSLIDTLEGQGLVRREPNPDDRRSIKIYLTPQGRQFFESMMPVGWEITERALSCLSDEQVDTLDSILRRVRKHLLEQLAQSGGDYGELEKKTEPN